MGKRMEAELGFLDNQINGYLRQGVSRKAAEMRGRRDPTVALRHE
ncbi:MAG: hypothetical protein ACRD8O_18695 [Bryobacteraceae bacterium]